MRSLFSFPLGLPRSGVFPPLPRLLFVCPRFPSWLGTLSGPTPGPEWVSGGWEVQLGVGHRACLGDFGDWGKSGGKGGIWVQRVKKTFSPPLSVSLSVFLSPPLSLSLFLSPSLVKVGEVAGKERGTLRLSAFGASQFLHKAESPSPGHWPGRLGMKTPASLPWLG